MFSSAPLSYWDVDEGSAPTAVTVKDPGTGFRLVVVGWNLTSPTAGRLKLFFGTDSAATRILNVVLPADSGVAIDLASPGKHIVGGSGAILKVTGPGVVRGTVYGYVERVET